MNKKTMINDFNFGWPVNFLIILAAAVFLMLAVIFICSFFIRASENKEILKYFDSVFLKRAATYNKTILIASVADRFLTWIFMGALLVIFWNNSFISSRISVWSAALVFFLFTFFLFLFLLPLQYYQEYVIAHKFGFSNQTLSAWFGEALKEAVLYMILSTAGLTAIYALIAYMPRHWWLVAIAIFIIFTIFASFIYPILIDPLFYKFKPLEDKELENSILEIAKKAGVSVGSVLIADASRKTNKVNAYFTGIGKSKRVVIYDNLLNNYSKKEVVSVVAHEVGHWKHKHIAKNMAIGIAGIVLLFLIMFFMKNGLNITTSVRLILVLFITFSLIAYITNPFSNYISRRFEEQADRTAAELTGDSSTQVQMLQKLAQSNLSYVNPSGILKFLIYTHPPIMERIDSAIKYDATKL